MECIALALLLTLCLCASSAAGQAGATVGLWEPFEVTLTAQVPLANPYVDGLPEGGKPHVVVSFTGVSGKAKGQHLTVPGFWDGGQTWKVRFAPPAPGEWSYVSASADPGLDGVKGTLHGRAWTKEELAASPARHGFVRVHTKGERAGRYFEYADGAPFLWIGDTWWPWASRAAKFWPRCQQVIDDRAARGFSVGQMMFGANSGVRFAGRDYQTLDFEGMHAAERFIAYANSKGLTPWIMPWWSAQNLPEIGAEKMRRWSRYVVHRLAAYNVIWNVGGEYNMYDFGGMGLPFWKDLGALMRAEDPYHHAIGVHNTPPTWEAGTMGNSGQWSTGEVLHDEPWLDFNDTQTGHSKSSNEHIPAVIAADYARRPIKPTLDTEPWYEFIEGNAPAADVRFAAWSSILSGAAGHTYGGGHQWWADIPDPSLKPREDYWPRPPLTVDTLDYPGARSIEFLAHFLRSMEWWKLEPHPELVSEYGAPFAAAIPGHAYVVYARYGGGLKLDLRGASGELHYTWYDLTTSKEAATGTVNGGAIRAFHAPDGHLGVGEFGDWLLYVRK